jgi:hypothetical protein
MSGFRGLHGVGGMAIIRVPGELCLAGSAMEVDVFVALAD